MQKIIPVNAALIPDVAKKVFEGEIFDVFQWPQKMFDGSTETFEMLRRADTVQILAIKNSQIILIEDAQPARPTQIHVPGGRVDAEDASWLVAAKRELLEETGMEFDTWRLIDVQQPIIKLEWFAPIFLAYNFKSEAALKPDEAGEQIAVMPHSFKEAKKQILSGRYPAISYLIPLFSKLESLDELLELPELTGNEVDR